MGGRAGADNVELFFSPSKLEVSAANPTVELVNQTEGRHNMLIGNEVDGDALAASEVVGPNARAPFTFADVPPGSYKIWCSIEDHVELGMVGTLTITP